MMDRSFQNGKGEYLFKTLTIINLKNGFVASLWAKRFVDELKERIEA
jgi:hypothetical protein